MNRIKQERKKQNLTQQDVVDLLKDLGIKCTKMAISKTENGETIPNVILAYAIAKALKVSINYLFKLD